jgi:hypothetical protein
VVVEEIIQKIKERMKSEVVEVGRIDCASHCLVNGNIISFENVVQI